jgi:hypothetical protein
VRVEATIAAAADGTACTVVLGSGEDDVELPLVCANGMLDIIPTDNGGGGGIGIPSTGIPGGCALPIASEGGMPFMVGADIAPFLGGGGGGIVLSPEEDFPFPLPFPFHLVGTQA